MHISMKRIFNQAALIKDNFVGPSSNVSIKYFLPVELPKNNSGNTEIRNERSIEKHIMVHPETHGQAAN